MTTRTRYSCLSAVAWVALAGLNASCDGGGARSPVSDATPPTAKGASAVAPVAGDAAVWEVGPNQFLRDSTTQFTALVSRLSCNSGVTGQVAAPTITTGEDTVVLTFVATPPSDGGTCQGNDQVPYVVDLPAPLGDRALVDGQCLPGAAAESTAFCIQGPARFTP